jgi:hypothetical protein
VNEACGIACGTRCGAAATGGRTAAAGSTTELGVDVVDVERALEYEGDLRRIWFCVWVGVGLGSVVGLCGLIGMINWEADGRQE